MAPPRFPYRARNYREAYGLPAVNGILFNTNHRGAVELRPERSPGPWHASRRYPVRGLYGHLMVRDRGYAPEYVEGGDAACIDEPDDFVWAIKCGFIA